MKNKELELHKAILQDLEINNLNELKRKILETHIPKYLLNLENDTVTTIVDEDLQYKLNRIDLGIKERISLISKYYK